MLDTETMTRDEKSLLLFLETRAVDHSGRVDTVYMNADDLVIAKRWNEEQFIDFGRYFASDITAGRTYRSSNYVRLSGAAWQTVAKLRRERAERTICDLIAPTLAVKRQEKELTSQSTECSESKTAPKG
jgi:hypothetical protein